MLCFSLLRFAFGRKLAGAGDGLRLSGGLVVFTSVRCIALGVGLLGSADGLLIGASFFFSSTLSS